MKYHTRVARLGAAGAGTIVVPPARLVALEGQGGTVSLHNRGNVFASGDRDEHDEEFVEGHCLVLGSPNSTALAYFKF